MIYQKEVQWKNLYATNTFRKNALLLDLSLMSNLDPYFEELSAKVKIPIPTLRKQLTQIIADISGIRNYIDAIIVPLDSCNQVVQKTILQGLNKLDNKCLFDHLINRYPGQIEIGIDIPIDQLQSFPPAYFSQTQVQSVRIFSIKLNIKNLDKLKSLKRIKTKLGVQLIHLNFTLINPEDLIEIQRFFIKQNFPIQSIILTTNLIDILKAPEFGKKINLNLEAGTVYNIAYHHNLCLKRFLCDALFNVFEYHQFSLEDTKNIGSYNAQDFKKVDKVFKTLQEIQKAKSKQKDYLGGFVVSPSLIVPALKNFFGGYQADLTLAADLLRFSMTSYKQALNANFKTMRIENYSM